MFLLALTTNHPSVARLPIPAHCPGLAHTHILCQPQARMHRQIGRTGRRCWMVAQLFATSGSGKFYSLDVVQLQLNERLRHTRKFSKLESTSVLDQRARGLPFRQQKYRCSSRHHTCQLSLDRYQINQSHSRPVFFRSAKQ